MAKCMGCGTTLQTTEPDKPGYVSEGTLVSHGDESYCYRCYQIRNYGKTSHYAFDITKYKNQLSPIKKNKSPVLLLLDVLDIYGSFHPVIIDAIRDSEVVILINKIDLLPKTMKLSRIEERVRELGRGFGLNVKNVISISSLKDFQLDKVMDSIIHLKKHGDVCLVGLANTGKSSFLNAIINKHAGQKKDLITTSYIQGTTCDVIRIPLDESAYLIDTPGLISDARYATYLSDASMKIITPKKYLKPTVFQLQAGQSVFVGGLFRIDLAEGENLSVTTFFANDLYIHRTKTENADSLYEKQVTLTLVPPTAEEQATIGPLVAKETLTLSEDRYDILVGGIGFIHLTGEKMKINTYAPEKIQISVVPSFL